MSLKKPQHPLNSAITSLGGVFCIYTIASVVTAILWSKAIDAALWCIIGFTVPSLLLVAYAAYCLRLNARSAVRDRFNYWSLAVFIPAVLVCVVLELFSGYTVNTANLRRKRLNELYLQQLDDEKLCTRLLTGVNAADEQYKNIDPAAIFKTGKVPMFKGVYSGDLASSFGDGGKLYLILGRYAANEMRKAAEKRDSEAFAANVKNMVRVMANAAACIRDPENSALILGREFHDILQSSVTAHFPDKNRLLNCLEALGYLRDVFESGIMSSTLYDTQSVLSRYDKLLKNSSRVNTMVNDDLTPVWSDIDIVAGKLFPLSRRSRLAFEYAAAVDLLNDYRGVVSSVSSSVDSRIKLLNGRFEKLKQNRHFSVLAMVPDIRSQLVKAGRVQHLIENAQMACEVEYYRRSNFRLPASLEDIKSSRMMFIPTGHLDGKDYSIVKGRFKDKDGKTYSGYSLSVPTGSFVITDKK
jgi:hypothetical protein